jgi:hypothetical protein
MSQMTIRKERALTSCITEKGCQHELETLTEEDTYVHTNRLSISAEAKTIATLTSWMAKKGY